MAKEQSQFAFALSIDTNTLDESHESSRKSDREELVSHGKLVYSILTEGDESRIASRYYQYRAMINNPEEYGYNVHHRVIKRLTPLDLRADKNIVPKIETVVEDMSHKMRNSFQGDVVENIQAFLQGISAAAFQGQKLEFGARVGFLGTNGDLTSSPAIMESVHKLSHDLQAEAAIWVRKLEIQPQQTQVWQV